VDNFVGNAALPALETSIYAGLDKMLHKVAYVNLLLNQLLTIDKKE
jgi:hypothetical protein